MARVKLLDKHTAELIAAGEVVERPSSVIKELAENCIDAGATKICIEIQNGGVSMMRITDNGCGIASEDVPTAFLRHATSKISTGEDLAAISTLGFRGEALASVCAVSRVELITRTEQEEAGTHFIIEGGDEVLCEEIGCARGTTIIVRDLFYNTPARMKFLKKDTSEALACAAVVDRIALSAPNVSIRFIRDGREQLLTPGDSKLKSAIFAVYGKEFTQGLMPVEYEHAGVKVSGYITKPVNARPKRNMQVFFINGRFVRSNTMQAALEEACKGAVMIGKYPGCVLGIELACAAVDINVHPAKLEVRFTNERPIFEAVYYAVKSSLSRFDERKEVVLPERKPVSIQPPTAPIPVSAQTTVFERPQRETAAERHNERGILPDTDGGALELRDSGSVYMPEPTREKSRVCLDIEYTEEDKAPAAARKETPEEKEEQPQIQEPSTEEPRQPDAFELPSYRILGEAFGTYILLECMDSIIMIDKHAAHERLIFERLMAGREKPESQLLLAPMTVTLDKREYSAALENIAEFAKAGFEVEDFGPGTLLVRAIPAALSGGDAAGAVIEIAGSFGSKADATMTARLERMYQTIACKAAIKAGDRSSASELSELVLRLEHNPEVRYCPHGRPISVRLTRRELEKNFGRV